MITLTPGALTQVKQLLSKENNPGIGLRIGVRPGGCSGFSYVLGFDAPQAGDNVEEMDGLKVLVDSKSVGYLQGIELDYQDGLQGKGFTFNNPNATKKCGCGESFSV